MDEKLLQEIKDHGFYTFIRSHIQGDVADIILNYVDLSALSFYGNEYDEIIDRITNIKEYEEK